MTDRHADPARTLAARARAVVLDLQADGLALHVDDAVLRDAATLGGLAAHVPVPAGTAS
jgi:hypothetical protein